MKNADKKLFMQVLDSINDQKLLHAPQRKFLAKMRPKPVDANESTPAARILHSINNYSGESPRTKNRD